MRILAIVLLTVSQFTALPFLAMVAANTVRHDAAIQQASDTNVTTIYKTVAM